MTEKRSDLFHPVQEVQRPNKTSVWNIIKCISKDCFLHKKNPQQNEKTPALSEHVTQTNQTIALENSRVITTNSTYHQRSCVEQWYINSIPRPTESR